MNTAATLFLRINPPCRKEGVARVDWAILALDGNKISGGYDAAIDHLNEADFAARDMVTIVIAPGEDVLFYNLAVPAAQKRYLKQTLPYLMEEVLAEPVEAIHFASGRERDGVIPVMAVSHARMQAWLALLQEHGITPDYMLSDTYAASLSTTEMHVLFDDKYAIISINDTALKTETGNIALFLGSCTGKDESGKTPVTTIKFIVAEAVLADVRTSAEIANTTAFLETRGIAGTVEKIDNTFDYLCRHLNNFYKTGRYKEIADLLQHPYQIQTVKKRRGSWRRIILALFICAGLKVVFDSATALYLHHQTGRLDEQIITLYRSLFPRDKKIINVRVQMENHLSEAVEPKSQAGFLTLVGLLSRQLSAMGELTELQVQQLRYDSQQNTLWLDISVKHIQQLDELKQGLGNQALDVTILSANSEQQWIKGRLRITSAWKSQYDE